MSHAPVPDTQARIIHSTIEGGAPRFVVISSRISFFISSVPNHSIITVSIRCDARISKTKKNNNRYQNYIIAPRGVGMRSVSVSNKVSAVELCTEGGTHFDVTDNAFTVQYSKHAFEICATRER